MALLINLFYFIAVKTNDRFPYQGLMVCTRSMSPCTASAKLNTRWVIMLYMRPAVLSGLDGYLLRMYERQWKSKLPAKGNQCLCDSYISIPGSLIQSKIKTNIFSVAFSQFMNETTRNLPGKLSIEGSDPWQRPPSWPTGVVLLMSVVIKLKRLSSV